MASSDRHEAPEIGAMIGRMLNALIRRAADGDWEALEALREIETLAPAAMNAGLGVAREQYSLAELAGVVGVTRSAVQQRARVESCNGTPGCGHALCVGMKRCRFPHPENCQCACHLTDAPKPGHVCNATTTRQENHA